MGHRLGPVTAERNLNVQEEDLGLRNFASNNQIWNECGSRETRGRSGTWQGRTYVFHEVLWSPKGQWVFLPTSRKSKPLPGVVGARFPRIPFAMWFWFRATQRGSYGWKESSYYSQEAAVVVPGNEQAHGRLAAPLSASPQQPAHLPSCWPQWSTWLWLHRGSGYTSSAAPQSWQVPDTFPELLPQSSWHAHDLGFPTSSDVSTLPVLQWLFLWSSNSLLLDDTCQPLPHVYKVWILQQIFISVPLTGALLPTFPLFHSLWDTLRSLPV